MKRSEIAMIIFVVGLSMSITFFVERSFFGDKIKREATIEEVGKISSHLTDVSKLIFNDSAINPTVEVYIEEDISTSFDKVNSRQDNEMKSQKDTDPSDKK